MTKLSVDRLFGASFTIHLTWIFSRSLRLFFMAGNLWTLVIFLHHCTFTIQWIQRERAQSLFSRFIFILYLMSFFIHLRFGSPVLTSIRLTHFPQSCRIKRLSIQMKFNPFTELKCNEFILFLFGLFFVRFPQRKLFFLFLSVNYKRLTKLWFSTIKPSFEHIKQCYYTSTWTSKKKQTKELKGTYTNTSIKSRTKINENRKKEELQVGRL